CQSPAAALGADSRNSSCNNGAPADAPDVAMATSDAETRHDRTSWSAKAAATLAAAVMGSSSFFEDRSLGMANVRRVTTDNPDRLASETLEQAKFRPLRVNALRASEPRLSFTRVAFVHLALSPSGSGRQSMPLLEAALNAGFCSSRTL